MGEGGFEEEEDFENIPEHLPGTAKYRGYRGGGNGLFCAESFKGYQSLSPRLVEVLIRSANSGLAESTWKQVGSMVWWGNFLNIHFTVQGGEEALGVMFESNRDEI